MQTGGSRCTHIWIKGKPKDTLRGKQPQQFPAGKETVLWAVFWFLGLEYHRFMWLDDGTMSKVPQCSLDHTSEGSRISGVKALQLGALKVTYCVFSDGILQILVVSSAYWSYCCWSYDRRPVKRKLLFTGHGFLFGTSDVSALDRSWLWSIYFVLWR